MDSLKSHWDSLFSKTAESKLGWFEKDTAKTYELLDQIPAWENATIFIPGAGTSVLIEELFSKGVSLVLNDISSEALSRVKKKLGDAAEKIQWLCQDISKPFPVSIPQIDIWIDRAVLHFLTEQAAVSGYFKNLKSRLKVGGHAMFAEFSLTGAPKCAGLILKRYSADILSKRLGKDFTLVSHFDYTFINPGGDPRPYIYALFKRDA